MINIERKTVLNPFGDEDSHYNQEIFYQCRDTGARYRRIVGGLAWPGIKPGFAVIVTEDRKKDYDLNTRHLHLLAEVEEVNVERLLQWCVNQDFSRQITWNWYGDPTNRPAMQFVHQLNKELYKQQRTGFVLAKAPHVDDTRGFEFCVNILRKNLEPEAKALHFGEESKLPGYLLELAPEDITKVRADVHPAIAALGYAVSALTVWTNSGLPRL